MSTDIFQKQDRSLTIWSDTLPDSDALLTTKIRSAFYDKPVNGHPLHDLGEGAYFSELFSDLEYAAKNNPTNTREENKFLDTTTPHAIINHAPRSTKLTKNGNNGNDFYCAVTESGTVIWVTPKEYLKYLNTRGKISQVFEVPKNGSGFTKNEQFRSSVVPIYRRYSKELIEEDVQNIPKQSHLLEKAFRDKFGNNRFSTNNPERLDEEIYKKQSKEDPVIGLKVADNSYEVLVHITDSLRNIDDSIGIGIYRNIADDEWGDGNDSGYRELVRKAEKPTDPRTLSAEKVLRHLNNGQKVQSGTEIQIVSPSKNTLTIDEIMKRERMYFSRILKAIHEKWETTQVY